jgi:hypothetical protein
MENKISKNNVNVILKNPKIFTPLPFGKSINSNGQPIIVEKLKGNKITSKPNVGATMKLF